MSANKRGFTIIEILLAVFILAMVLSTIYGAYQSTFRIIKEVDRDGEAYGMARSTLSRMMRDLGSLVTPGSDFAFVSGNSAAAGGDFMDLSFRSRAHLSFSEKEPSGTIADITYYVDDEGPDGTHRLMRRDLPVGETDSFARQKPGFVICEGLYSLKYVFTDTSGTERDTWDAASDASGVKNKAPSLVTIELKIINPDDKEHPYLFTTKVYLAVSGAVPLIQ